MRTKLSQAGIDAKGKGVMDNPKCRCGADMRDGGSAGWYCVRGWDCPAPLLVPPHRSDKQRIAELDAEVKRLRSERDRMRRAILDQLVSAEIRDALYDVDPPPEWTPKAQGEGA